MVEVAYGVGWRRRRGGGLFSKKDILFLNSTKKCGPRPPQQMPLCFRHVIPIGGPEMLEIVTISV
jgi:hypothetical protein